MSVVQYGMPDSEKFSPAGICLAKLSQFDSTSPDHTQPPHCAIPGKPLRCKLQGLTLGVVDSEPW